VVVAAGMKILRVEAYEVVVPTRAGRVNSPEFGRVVFDEAPKLVFEARTDEGVAGLGEGPRGWGEAGLRAAMACLKDRPVESLCFQEPPLIDLSRHDMFGPEATRPHRYHERSFNSYEQVGVHAVLLDLLGRKLGVPVCALLGGAYRDRVAVETWMGRMTPADSARVCREAKEQGYHGVKFKCALEDDNVERAEAIREACGADFKLTLDPNARFYRYAEAMPVLRRLAAVGNVGCVEDPFPQEDLEPYRLLRGHGLFAVAMHLGYEPLLVEAIRQHACDLVNFSATPWDVRSGGAICWAAGVPTWQGSGVDLGILEALFLHVAAATKSMTHPSDLFGRTIREHNLITDSFVAEDGALRVPAGAGLGVELDREALDRYARRRFSFEL
jgi:muconate cycloisomerase